MSSPLRNPKISGKEPSFRHLDSPDVTWQQVRRQRNADGSEASVWEKWLAFSPAPQYLSLYAKYDPGMIVRRHGHYSPHVVFVIEGEIWCGQRLCPSGTHIELPFGAAFGPFRAGPDGATLFEVMMGDPRSWGDDPGAFERALADNGAEALPDVALDFPPWLKDLRTHWSGDASASPSPRFGPPDRAALPDDLAVLLDLATPPGGEPLPTVAVLAHQPALLGPFLGWAAALALHGALPKRDHEILALRISWHCQSSFEWDEHAEYARHAGLGDDEIDRIRVGPDAAGWTTHEAALLRAVDGLHRNHSVDDATWATLCQHYSPGALVEIPYVVGQYAMLSMVANTIGI
jgi:alkylhydroperoxidase family enzyme